MLLLAIGGQLLPRSLAPKFSATKLDYKIVELSPRFAQSLVIYENMTQFSESRLSS